MAFSDLDRMVKQFENPRAIRLWRALIPLKSTIAFMNTGAHPDDETTPMLAALALRDGVKVSHACANRGEGGQNAIGPETGCDLGAIRTREMERAAEVINMTQYWLSETPEDTIFDSGFSKSGDETLEKWGEMRTLERFVRILRRERPDIICTTFLDIPGQHGHHRAMTRTAFKAVLAAADPKMFPDQGLAPWQVKKMYLPAWSGAGDAYDDDVPPPAATLHIDATGEDTVLGADYAQIAQYSRSFHRTQGMGKWVEPGLESVWPLHLAWANDGNRGSEETIFDGLPRTLRDLAAYADAPEISGYLSAAQDAIDTAISSWPDYHKVTEFAVQALIQIDLAANNCPESSKTEVIHRLSEKRRQISRVLVISQNIRCRLTLSESEVHPGARVNARIWLHSPKVKVVPTLRLPEGWEAGPFKEGICEIKIPADAPISDPYPDTWYPDRANSPVSVELNWRINGTDIYCDIDPEQRFHVLPKQMIKLSPSQAIVTLSDPSPVCVNASHVYPAGSKLTLSAQSDWRVETTSEGILLTPSKSIDEGRYDIPVMLNNQKAWEVRRLFHSHIGQTIRCIPAKLRVQVMNVKLPKGRIAYIGGGNDRTAYWLEKLGIRIECLSALDVTTTDFSAYDTILIGIFAFRTCQQLHVRLDELHQWVFAGGNLVTLYHRPWDNWNPETTAPGYLKIGKPSLRWRVTDENATVRHLQPEHAILNTPNQITEKDWSGWHKERGLYFAREWDAAYTPLLEMADPDEAPLQGALLSGQFGKGRHTHTSLILHHQVEYLVPGAFRLLANLLISTR